MAINSSPCTGRIRKYELNPAESQMSPNPTVLDACIPGTPSARERICAPITSWKPRPNKANRGKSLLFIDGPQGVGLERLAFPLSSSLVLAYLLYLIRREEPPT